MWQVFHEIGQQIPGLSYQQFMLKTASGAAPFTLKATPNHQQEESVSLIISIVVKQTNALVCGEVVP